MITGIEIYEFIKPNLGNVSFHGETYKDEESVENVRKYEDLLYYLIEDLCETYCKTQNRHEASGKEINGEAKRILLLIKDKLNEIEIEED